MQSHIESRLSSTGWQIKYGGDMGCCLRLLTSLAAITKPENQDRCYYYSRSIAYCTDATDENQPIDAFPRPRNIVRDFGVPGVLSMAGTHLACRRVATA